MDITDMIKAVQKKLGVDADGKAGTETWGAIFAALVKPTIAGKPPDEAIDKVDDRSEGNIATLLEEVRPMARALVQKAAANGIQIKVISATRTFAEQDALFAKGRTAPGSIVTNAQGGFSNHNFGLAFDVGVFEGKKYMPESPKYAAVGALGLELGLEWGGSGVVRVGRIIGERTRSVPVIALLHFIRAADLDGSRDIEQLETAADAALATGGVVSVIAIGTRGGGVQAETPNIEDIDLAVRGIEHPDCPRPFRPEILQKHTDARRIEQGNTERVEETLFDRVDGSRRHVRPHSQISLGPAAGLSRGTDAVHGSPRTGVEGPDTSAGG